MTRLSSPSWTPITCAAATLVLALLGIFYPVVEFTVHTWLSNDTYLHDFLIPFVSIWLIWRERQILRHLSPQPAWIALFLFLGLSVVEELGALSNTIVVEQFALVGLVISGIWFLIGHASFRHLLFPLLFLFLAIPFGESFIPPLMDLTADFATLLLRLTGIPVFREGNFLSLPTGNWSVVEACSGLRYLIASLTLGVLFAQMAFHRWSRRLLFLLASLVIPVVANGVRAYLIILIGHLSGMRLAVGVDHLIYGWIFFGLVMYLLFWLGSLFRDAPLPIAAQPASPSFGMATQTLRTPFWLALLPLALIGLSRWHTLDHQPSQTLPPMSPLALPRWPSWIASPDTPVWTPHFSGARWKIEQSYHQADTESTLTLYLAHYQNQGLGHSLVTTGNTLVIPQDHQWTLIRANSSHLLPVSLTNIPFTEALIGSSHEQRLVWQFLRVGQHWLTSPYQVKWWEAWDLFTGHGDGANLLILSTPYDPLQPQRATSTLQTFCHDILPTLDAQPDSRP